MKIFLTIFSFYAWLILSACNPNEVRKVKPPVKPSVSTGGVSGPGLPLANAPGVSGPGVSGGNKPGASTGGVSGPGLPLVPGPGVSGPGVSGGSNPGASGGGVSGPGLPVGDGPSVSAPSGSAPVPGSTDVTKCPTVSSGPEPCVASECMTKGCKSKKICCPNGCGGSVCVKPK